MIRLPPDDDSLTSLERQSIPSNTRSNVSFHLDRILGIGGMAVAFLGMRVAPDGTTPVVLKVILPQMVRDAGHTALLSVKKETVALGRLNERVPATPFVVRLIEGGSLMVEQRGSALELPWLALEYVHGGAEGTTLEQRIVYSVLKTGFAFDPDRVVHALASMATGLDAIHEVGVLHRDIKPGNILCCGFGGDEIFKIADFGIARPQGVAATFGGMPLGTPGYAAPEQVMLDDQRLGPATDVFSLAAVVFRMLTGEEYFPVDNPIDGVVLARDAHRRKLLETSGLCPELRDRPSTCAAIDAILARATAPDAQHRPPSASLFAAAILPQLRSESRRRPTLRHLRSIADASSVFSDWRWTVRHRPGEDRVVRSVAWDGDGRCLAACDGGLAFWNGAAWERARCEGLSLVQFVRRIDAGVWLVGGDEATIAHYSTNGVSKVVRAADPSVSFTHASGDIDDLAVLVGTRPADSPVLYALAAGRWLKPAALPKATSIASIARIEDEKWLVVGRSTAGDGFVAIYSPLLWEVTRLKTSQVRAFLSTAGELNLNLGIAVGAGGRSVRIDRGVPHESIVPGEPDLSAVALDISGCAWATSLGTIWRQPADDGARFSCMWNDPKWTAPFVSVFADMGLLMAMTADGGIVEGRSVLSASRAPVRK